MGGRTHRVDGRRAGQLGGLLRRLPDERREAELRQRRGVHRELQQLRARGEHAEAVLREGHEGEGRQGAMRMGWG